MSKKLQYVMQETAEKIHGTTNPRIARQQMTDLVEACIKAGVPTPTEFGSPCRRQYIEMQRRMNALKVNNG